MRKKRAEIKNIIAEKIFSVTEFIDHVNGFFKSQTFRITGEISQFKRQNGSGHCYFPIKDKVGGGVIDCIIWSRNYDMCGVHLEVGMEIILTGHPNIYAPNGRLSFVAGVVELIGEGALKKAYDDLKLKLEREGLFDISKKRPIPEYPRNIGVITSLQGAVISDFRHNLGKFGFKVTLVDSRVEGQAAISDLLAAIRQIRRQDIDVLVIIRGGGSLESLQAFNNETLVREIAKFPVPVIAGIGHDQDVPLLALAADHMTSTPTAAAHLLSASWAEAYAKVSQIFHKFTQVHLEIKRIRTDLNLSWRSIIDHTAQRIKNIQEQMAFSEQTIKLNDPARQLKLGYSIVRSGGKIVRSVRSVDREMTLSTELADGTVYSTVTKIN